MTARMLLLPLMALTLGLLAAACGGGDDTAQPTGRLTDPRSVPTATPWAEPPETVILEPGALTPIAQEEDGQEANGEDGANGGDGTVTPGECGETYTVEPGDVPFTIADKCGVDVDDLLAANPDVTPTSLRVGQELKLP